MIFVTVGNSHHGSMRLLNGVEALAAEGFFAGEPVIVQSGNNPDFAPRYCQNRPFLSLDEFNQTIRDARLVISHAGAGTISSVLRTGKTPIVVPRRVKYNEVIDDHQIELLEAWETRKLLVPAYEIEDLPAAMREAATRPPVMVNFTEAGLAKIGSALDQLLKGSRGV